MTGMARAVVAAFALWLALAPAMATPKFPALTGRVVDDAHILSDATRAELTDKLAALEAKTSRQLVVVTIPSLQGYEISDFGYQLGRAWGIGQARLNNGVLFIVAPTEHKVRIEVGYGLEPVLTDALSEVILQGQVLPKFRNNDFNGGVIAGTDALIAQLSLDRSAAEARAAAAEKQAQAQAQNNGGGGNLQFVILLIMIGFFIFGRGLGLWPLLFLAGSSRGGGNWGGGFGGGGGFSGGGGSFGGGGASGSW